MDGKAAIGASGILVTICLISLISGSTPPGVTAFTDAIATGSLDASSLLGFLIVIAFAWVIWYIAYWNIREIRRNRQENGKEPGR